MDRGRSLKRKPNPKENAGFLSLLTFSYLLPFIRTGRKRDIEESDLYEVVESFQAKTLADELEGYWNEQKARKGKDASVTAAVLSCYRSTFIFLGLSQLTMKIIYTFSMPWALGKFVSYFSANQTGITREMAIYYGAIMVSINFLTGVWEQHFALWKLELGIKVQAAISSLLYRKALTLSQSKILEISTGRIVTSIVKDASSINQVTQYGIDYILETCQVLLVCYMLYSKLGNFSLSGLCILGISTILQIAASRITYGKRSNCNAKSDQRTQQTQETLSYIRLIKMYRWESFFKDQLYKLRNVELQNLRLVYIWKSISVILGIVSGKLAQVSIFALSLYSGNPLSTENIYYIQQLFQKVAKAMIFIPLGIQSIAEFLICIKRINFILNAEENDIVYRSTIQMLKPSIALQNVDVEFGNRKLLHDLNLNLGTGLHIVVGPSGSGKSSLVKTILEEYTITAGTLKTHGTISYSNQNPWLFPSSIKQNILFGQIYDETKYNRVLEMCCLTYDINNFANGDETILTDCGATLSRGQQARINMARAIYKDSDIYLLDDCLASLDVQIKTQVFNNVIKNYLKGKLCLLITHSTQFVVQADTVTFIADSTIKYSGDPIHIPDNLFQQIEQDQSDDVDETVYGNDSEDKLVENGEMLEKTPLLQQEKKCGNDNIYSEKKKTGRVNFSCYKRYFQFGGGIIMAITLIGLHVICESTNGISEKFMSAWVNAQSKNSLNSTANISSEFLTSIGPTETINLSTLPPLEGTVDGSFSTETSGVSTESLTTNSTKIFNANLPTYLSHFSEGQPNFDPYAFAKMMFMLYIAATLLSATFVVIRCLLTYYYTIKVSRNMHKSMVLNILQGSMTFFDTHLIGNILTRFSRDLFIVDEFIPFIWLEGIRLFFLLPLCLLLIASVSIKLAFCSIVLSTIFYFLCNYILSTTRSTQRLSNSTLSPIIGHLSSTLEGLIVIRAYGRQQILKDEFDKHLNVNISASHLREIAIRVLGLYSHTVASLFSCLITFGLLFMNIGAKAGDAGLVLSQSNLLCMFLEYGLLMWMIMENSMTSVERALEYTKLPQENQSGSELDHWPRKGAVKFQNVSLKYRKKGETVLQNLTFSVDPEEKIGIVGRTGAGKSSIIVALFKMYDIEGDIFIDNVNIKTISLECLRTHLAIIPQDPVIFSGTLRTNVDPRNIVSDEQIWKILEVVNLKSQFNSLDENITKKNLSIGQKQLICLARALTRKCKIVILDEATANMDENMDIFIQSKIRELFKFCTVITIAHRLHTVKNCDKIIVMDKGKIIEFDTPDNLLNNTNGQFYSMMYKKKNKSE